MTTSKGTSPVGSKLSTPQSAKAMSEMTTLMSAACIMDVARKKPTEVV